MRGANNLLTLPPTFFRLASSWSIMPALVVITILPNCSSKRAGWDQPLAVWLRRPAQQLVVAGRAHTEACWQH